MPHPGRQPALLVFALLVFAPLAATLAADGKRSAPDPATLPPPLSITIPKLSGKLVIDGELDEPVWAQAAVAGPFTRADGAGPAREATLVRLWYDDAALHLGWTCRDTDIQATLTGRDQKFWEEEVAEFFVTRGDLASYWELQWNPLGGEFDALIRNTLDERGVSRRFQGDWSYTAAGMSSAVKVRGTVGDSSDRDESWQVEVSIPFAALGGPAPQPGDRWRANLYRYNRTTGLPLEMLAWSPPILDGFHQPTRFGFLTFGPAPTSP